MVEFCPKCEALLVPHKGTLKCRKCGYTKPIQEGIDYILKSHITHAPKGRLVIEEATRRRRLINREELEDEGFDTFDEYE